MAKELVWIDLEMTGLNPQIHKIIEIATIITDSELNIIAKGPDLVINASDDELNKMNAYVRDCLLYTSPSPRDRTRSRMPSSA